MNCITLRLFVCLSLLSAYTLLTDRVPRIIGGLKVRKNGDWPFLIAVYYKWMYRCMFSLITTQNSLGPANCLFNLNISSFYGRVGHFNRFMGIRVIFSHYVIHDSYEYISGKDDIGMLILNKPITVSLLIQPALLPNNNTLIYCSNEVVSAGWGCTMLNSFCFVTNLRVVSLSLDNEYGADANHIISDKEIYVSRPNTRHVALTMGDLGAPLLRKCGDQWILIGIKSRLLNIYHKYETFMSIQAYLQWINENIIGVLNNYKES